MKNLKTIIAVIAISLSTVFSVSATDTKPKKAKTLRTEISALIGENIPLKFNKTTIAEVSFIVNNRNEIVVLSVKSEVSELNSFIKRKLNYKIITIKGVKKGEVYKMPLKINIK
ncbi:hypothetical protein SHK09_10700 [Polaribacter sp. PL03]|uniref:hypothetical protein n=1 Tax=Polaribacter sp. PL03 TaxID=3088353 RepID=UPI0029CC44F7|nr:hypothetical protein [Polaribacter sp. PL03]MDX6747261.1 hypothetical protein [Polaribacter sp. PL03]